MNQSHVHLLRGCAPTPLAHYLKALGVLRLVATQVDESVRGAWKDGAFALVTRLSADELVGFFLRDYRPTPLLSPWNGGSGFYAGDNKDGFAALEVSDAPRFQAYRRAIAEAKSIVAGRAERPAGEEKALMLRECLRKWGAASYSWLRAAFSLDGAGEPRFPALLGTGGNDGRLDFTNNYMQRLVSLFDPTTGEPRGSNDEMLRLSLFRAPAAVLEKNPIGQFYPGATGGANATSGFDADGLMNMWDFVLMLEGSLVLRVASMRQLDTGATVQAAAPFAIRSQGTGYASASPADASSRGEQWMPIWKNAASLPEVSALFDEGRLQGGHQPARGTLEATRALASLGVARGVSSFVRFGYFERNGLSNLAVPVGQLDVRLRPEVRLLDEVDGFLRSLARAGDQKGAPLSLARSARSLEKAIYAASLPSATRETWAELVCVLGDVEHGFLAHPKSTKGFNLRPLKKLSPGWLDQIDDGSPEVRIARAIASQGHRDLGPIRTNAIPLQAPKFETFATTAESLAMSPSIVWQHRNLVDDLIAVAQRRVVDGTAEGTGAMPLDGRQFASLDDLDAFVAGATDDARIARLARGLFALDWAKVHGVTPERGGPPNPIVAMVRLAYLPYPIRPLRPRLDATPLRALAGGDLGSATRLLLARLGAAGLRPKLRHVVGDEGFARRLAASVAIPLHQRDYVRLLTCVTKPFAEESSNES